MKEPIKMCFELPDKCPKDLELMSIWIQAWNVYSNELSDLEKKAAINWITSRLQTEL